MKSMLKRIWIHVYKSHPLPQFVFKHYITTREGGLQNMYIDFCAHYWRGVEALHYEHHHPLRFWEEGSPPSSPAFAVWSWSIVYGPRLVVGPYIDSSELSYIATISYNTDTILPALIEVWAGTQKPDFNYLKFCHIEK